MVRWFIRLTLLGYYGIFLLLTASLAYHWAAFRQPPLQPIAFPHTVHAGRLGLACTFCHVDAARSPQAGVPPVEKCLSCHRSIALDNPEVQKLHQHSTQQEPILWNRVHTLPDHVHFTHKRHIKAGIDCSACHGAIAGMTRVRQVRTLEMGWCVTCHRFKGAPTDCATCHK
jgi:hypothetical protein